MSKNMNRAVGELRLQRLEVLAGEQRLDDAAREEALEPRLPFLETPDGEAPSHDVGHSPT